MKAILNFTYERVTLLGYSMGGRAALSFAAHYPNMTKALILESVNPGLTDENLRLERSEQDDKLAEFIESHSIESFVDYWMNISLFETQKNLSKEKLDIVRNLKLENSRIGLANSLRGFSLGKMPPLNDLMINFQAPALLITGELDQKYTGISSGIAGLSPGVTHVVIKNAGHNTHLEQPSLFIDVINNFLGQF
jgi:2-succinyl-6-hydroxy-2,4-cyclohexadiene-1-carboxylate synthase